MLRGVNGPTQTNVILELTITVHLVHVLGRDSNDPALLDDLGVFSRDRLNNLEVLHRDLSPSAPEILQNNFPLPNLPMAALLPSAPTG
jgi:hypothetical protein